MAIKSKGTWFAAIGVFTIGLAFSDGVTAQRKQSSKFEPFDRNNFDRSFVISNKWFPLTPGTQMIYKGSTQEEGKRVPHRVVQTVLDMTKIVNGVRTLVVWDVDYKDGQLEESELVFFAQDKEGNVWHMGEIVELYEDDDLKGALAWLAGVAGARAGIRMKADPRPGTASYAEGYAPPPFNWTDRGRVDKIGASTCVPTGCYKNVLVIAESSEKEGPNAEHLKYYAPDVGYIRVAWRGKGEKLRETLELAKIVKLSPESLSKARERAMEIEERAYIYGRTAPAERLATGQ